MTASTQYLFGKEPFRIGVSYWPQQSGLAMWKHFDVDDFSAGDDVEGQRAQRRQEASAPFLCLDDGRQPHTVAGAHGRRPPQAGNGGLPENVLGFTPLERQTALVTAQGRELETSGR